jgi:uncharacterized membrane protein YphA (DoxX/SURF4 family)
VASLIAAPGTQSIGSWSIGLLGVVVGTALLLGILTPVAGALAALCNLCSVFWFEVSGAGARGNLVITVYLIIMSMVVVLLGPGAFSLDAYLFGRREIVIPEARRSRGG